MTQHRDPFTTVLVCRSIHPDSLLADLHKIFQNVRYFPDDGTQPSTEDFADADAIFTFMLPPALVDFTQTPRLKLFQLLSAGVGHITGTPYYLSIPSSSPVVFASASGIHACTIGEHCVSTAMMLYHRLQRLVIIAAVEQRWSLATEQSPDGLFVQELRGQTVGILGYGQIGRETARMFQSMGSVLVAATRDGRAGVPASGYRIPHTGDPTGNLPEAFYSTSSPASLKEFLNRCDIVVNTLPSSSGTIGFMGEEQFRAMKNDALFINVGRGDTVVTDALVRALSAPAIVGEAADTVGALRIGGASLDVTDPEPLPPHHVLFTLPNTIITPHMSGLSKTYFVRAVDLLLQNVERLRTGKGALNAVRGRGENDAARM